jgi:phosphoribosylformylglycinamidine (FGAM) synthase PurS component
MTEINPDRITGIISLAVFPQDKGEYVCEISPSLSVGETSLEENCSQNCTRFYGQTKEHAIAIALENLANQYREEAESDQNIDALAVERSESGEAIQNHYHIIVHYEEIAEAESQFEAIHNTLLGNTIVENAKISAIKVCPDMPINPLVRSWD